LGDYDRSRKAEYFSPAFRGIAMTVMSNPAQTHTAKPLSVYTVLLWCSFPILLLVSLYGASQHMKSHDSVFDTEDGFGPAIQGIVQHHRLGMIDPIYGWWCFACRMPIVPFLGAASYWVSPKIAVFLVLKNLIFWSLWICALFLLKRRYRIPDKWALVTVLLLLLAPYDVSIAGWVDAEEGFLFSLIALLFSLLLTLEGPLSAAAAGLVMATIYLTKSSMLPLCVTVSIWIVAKYWWNPRIALVPLIGLGLAIFGWGIYVQEVSGVFAFGTDESSWNGWNFYKGNNPHAYSIYPRISLDQLDSDSEAHRLLPFVPVRNEWELSHAQAALALRYIRENPGGVLKMDLKKLFVACCDLKESPEKDRGHTRVGIITSGLVNHLALASVFLLVIANVRRRQASQAEILAVLLTAAYLLPYFAGFLYMRHMAPIYGVVALTAAVQLTRLRAPVPDVGVPFRRSWAG
jgi:hypothetical protein